MIPSRLTTRWLAACIAFGVLYAAGCAADDEAPAPDVARRDVDLSGPSGRAEPLAPGDNVAPDGGQADASIGPSSACVDAGGTCRKSACRQNEVRSDLECGTERGCCLPNL